MLHVIPDTIVQKRGKFTISGQTAVRQTLNTTDPVMFRVCETTKVINV